MTRENKLALVVGFGLILFVGILISDHFAPSPHRSNADLGDPSLAARGQKQRGLTELNPRAPLASNSGTGAGAPGSAPSILGPGATMPGDAGAGSSGPSPGEAPLGPGIRVAGQGVQPTPEEARARLSPPPAGPEAAPTERVYTIRDGDTLYAIAKRELGNGSLWTSIRDLNGLKDGKSLRVGTKLRLPTAGGGIERVALGGTAAPEEPAMREYVVREGDTLIDIAERQLGKRSRWTELHEINKSRVKDPNHVAPGTRLLLPAASKRGTRA